MYVDPSTPPISVRGTRLLSSVGTKLGPLMMSFNWNMLPTWENVGKSVLGFVGCDLGHIVGRHWLVADGLEGTPQGTVH